MLGGIEQTDRHARWRWLGGNRQPFNDWWKGQFDQACKSFLPYSKVRILVPLPDASARPIHGRDNLLFIPLNRIAQVRLKTITMASKVERNHKWAERRTRDLTLRQQGTITFPWWRTALSVKIANLQIIKSKVWGRLIGKGFLEISQLKLFPPFIQSYVCH